jgi:histidinol-phosphate aminotransferase
MSRFDGIVPERIRALGAYISGKPMKQAEAESGFPCIKLASNENPFGPSPRALAAMERAARTAHLYPDNECPELKKRLAALHGLDPRQLLITAGSTSLLDAAARTLLAPGLNAITSERSFIMYPLVTRATGAELRRAPMRGDAFDLDAIADAIDDKTRIIFLANPNNPTGTMIEAPVIDRFLDRLPDHVVLLLDEAYHDFAEHLARKRNMEHSHALDYVHAERNVIVARTFSKVHGLAGMRVGYGMGPTELMGYIGRVRTVFVVSSTGEAGALASLDDREHFDRVLRNNDQGAEYLMAGLREMGYHPVETWANFLYCEIGEDAAAFAQRMQREGVVIRPLNGEWGARTAIRVTIGTPQENETFLKAMKRIVGASSHVTP